MNCNRVDRSFPFPVTLLPIVGTIRVRPPVDLIKILTNQLWLTNAKLRYGVFLTCWYTGANVTTDDCDDEVAPMGTVRDNLGGFDYLMLDFSLRLSSFSGSGPHLRV